VGGSLAASVTNSATGDGVGVVTWSYTVSNSDTDVQRLGKDETATEKFTVKIIDSTGKEDTQVITVTITGTNDAPVITVAAGDADSAGLTEANAGLTASDTLTVTDVDVTDLVNPSVVSVSTSGDTGGLTNLQLLAMMSVAPSPVDTTTTTTGQITWTFNSGLQAFNHLDDGESLTLTYTVRATDDSGAVNNSDDQTVTITINGTDDQPDAGCGDFGLGSRSRSELEYDRQRPLGHAGGRGRGRGDADLRHQWRHGGRWGVDAGGRLRHAGGEHHDRCVHLHEKRGSD
jgi:VCBS repeat-containing protein